MSIKQKTHMKRLCIFIILCTIFSLSVSKISAATFYASSSSSSVASGGAFTVTIQLSEAGSGVFYLSGSNASVPGSVYCDTTCSVSATAGSSGTASVTVTAGAAGTKDEVTTQANSEQITGSRTVSVSIASSGSGNTPSNPTSPTNPTNPDGSANGNTETPEDKPDDGKSSEASLASLKVSKGKLSPEFNEATTSYDLGLTSDITSIEIDAKAKDAKATVSGAGKHTVVVGKQDITISVAAENGSVKTYVIHVTVEEKPKDFVTHNDQKLGVVTNLDEVIAPEGYTKTEVTLNGKKITGWYNATSKITLTYLADKDMVKNFYMVENGKVTSIYKPISILGRSLVVIDVPKELQTKKGMQYTTVTVDNQKLKGWTFDDKSFANYYLIYIMDLNGKVKYYQYEKTEETLQLYSGAAPISASDYDVNDQGGGNILLTYGAIATSIVLLGAVVYISLRNKKNVAYLMTQRRLNYMNQDAIPKEAEIISEDVTEE